MVKSVTCSYDNWENKATSLTNIVHFDGEYASG